MADGLATGLGFTLALVALGAVREIAGRGTLLSQARLMFGEWGDALELVLVPEHPGFILALLPPGAFIALGLLIAGRNWLDARLQERAAAESQGSPATAESGAGP